MAGAQCALLLLSPQHPRKRSRLWNSCAQLAFLTLAGYFSTVQYAHCAPDEMQEAGMDAAIDLTSDCPIPAALALGSARTLATKEVLFREGDQGLTFT